ncbi:g5874 [Coccomyxa elongata]
MLGRLDAQGRAVTKSMATLVTRTDHQPSLSPVGLEDKRAGIRRQQLASKPVQLVRIGESATAKAINVASRAATVTVGKTKVALVPPSAAIPPQRNSTMPRNGFQRTGSRTPVTAPQPTREVPASNAAIVRVGKTKAVQPAAAAQAPKARPPATRLRKARPPNVRKTRAAKPAITRAAHRNLLDAVGAPMSAAPRSAAAQSAGGLAGGPGSSAAGVEDGMTEEWFESVAETPTPYSLNLQQHRKLQKLFIEHVARMWFHKRTEESDARLRAIIASVRCHDMVPEVLARLKIPFLVQILYQHPNKFVSTQAKLLNDSDDWKKALALMRKIAMKQLGLTKEHADTIVANMVKNYSLPTTAAAAAGPSSKAPAGAQDEGGNAGKQDQGGNAGRRGKRGRRSHLHSSPSPVKRPRDAVAPGEGMTLRDRVVQPAMKKPKTVQEMERSQLPAILGLQAVESPREYDAAVEWRLPESMIQADHAPDVASPSDYQAPARVPAVSMAPGAQPQKRRPGRPPKKVKLAAQDPVGNQAEATIRAAPVEADCDLPSVARQDAMPEAQPLHLASGVAPVAQATAPGILNERKRARRLVPASVVDAMPGAPRPRGQPPRATPRGLLKRQQPRDATQASGTHAGALLGLAGGSLPARPSSTSAKSGSGHGAGSSPRSLLPVPAPTAEYLPSAAVAADQLAVPVPAHEALDPLPAAEELSDAGATPVQPTMAPDALDQLPTSAAQERPPVAVTADLALGLSPGLDADTDQIAAACPGLLAADAQLSAALVASHVAAPLPSLTAMAEQHMDEPPLPQPQSPLWDPPGSAGQPARAGSPASGGFSQLLHETTEPAGISGGSCPAAQALTWSPLLLPLPPPDPVDDEARGGSGGPSPLLRPATAEQPEQHSFPSRSRASDSSRGITLAPGLPIHTSGSTAFDSISSAGCQPSAPVLPALGTPLSQGTSTSAAPAMASIPMAHLLPRPAAGPAQQHSSVGDGISAFVQQQQLQQQQQHQQQQEEAGSVAEQIFSQHAPSRGLLTELFASQSWWRADGTFKLKTGSSRAKEVVDRHSDTEHPARRTARKQPEPPLSSPQPQLPQIEPGYELQPSCPQPQPPQMETPRGASPLRQCSPKATSEPHSHEAAACNASPHTTRRSHSLPNGVQLPAPELPEQWQCAQGLSWLHHCAGQPVLVVEPLERKV